MQQQMWRDYARDTRKRSEAKQARAAEHRE